MYATKVKYTFYIATFFLEVHYFECALHFLSLSSKKFEKSCYIFWLFIAGFEKYIKKELFISCNRILNHFCQTLLYYITDINLNIFCWKIHLHVHTNGLNTSYCNLIILYKILICTMHLWIKWREYKLFQIHIRHLHVSNSSYQQYIQMITGMIGSNAGFWHTLSKL